jgi:hypothetical protein
MFNRYSRARHQDAFYVFLTRLYDLLPQSARSSIYVADTHDDLTNHAWITDLEKKNIVILAMGFENHGDLGGMYKFDNVKAIIRCYPFIDNYRPWPPVSYKIKNGIPVIPINEDPRTILIPISPNIMEEKLNLDKKYRLNFTGQISGSRLVKLQKMSGFFNNEDLIRVFEGWGALRTIKEATSNVLTHKDYIESLSSSKVALCFAGHSHETHRHIESAMQGCAIITDPLPDIDFYNAAPFVRSIGWDQSHVEFVIKNHVELGNAAYQWYNEHASPQAVSNRICREFERIGI